MSWRFSHCIALVAMLMMACEPHVQPPTPPASVDKVAAFPGAQGGGMYVTGGRGGLVYHVTSLSDDPNDSGSLRYILKTPGKKIVVFDVSGVIQLKRQLDITEGALTIAGQTAPGDGICIAGHPVVIKASNVIIRFVRFRMGDESGEEGDALTCTEKNDIMIDHCSFSWSTDECVSCYGNTNFTMQYCIISESLRNSTHGKGRHGYGGIWGGKNATFHHNLLAHHDSRNPRFDHSYVDNKCFGPVDYVNNVVYNWGGNSTYGGEGAGQPRLINMVNNYYKPGPATSSSKRTRLLDPTISCSSCSKLGTFFPGKFYLAGNYMHGSETVTNDNWKGSTVQTDEVKSLTPWTDGLTLMTQTQTAQDAYAATLEKAGCSLVRDDVDKRIVDEVRNASYTYTGSNGSTNGLIDSQKDVGAWPQYKTTTAPVDTDKDGMPDEWETANGLNPTNLWDGKDCTLSQEYTNVEVYLNSLVQHLY